MRGADYWLEVNEDMCCEYISWNDGTADCYMHMGGDMFDQTGTLDDEATISAQIYQFEELEEYVETDDEDWEDWGEEWDEDYYGGCDW
mgnify:FL=1